MSQSWGLFTESRYVSEDALKNLKEYQYKSVDNSPTTKYILRHYWNWAVTLFPMWMAPNLITLIGFSFIIVNLITVSIWMPDLVGPAPPWVYYTSALGLWLYSTFDNVDGKQARRTGSSSPLGELFDHGCDAFNCSFGAIVQAGCMSFGHTWKSAYLLLLTTLPFYLSTWEEYHTGVLYLGYINGPTEGLIVAVIVMVLSGVYGSWIWHETLHDLFGSWAIGFIPSHYTLFDILVISMSMLLWLIHAPSCFYHVYKSSRDQNKSFYRVAIIQNIPITIYLLAGYFWLASPYSYIFSHHHFILFALTTGIVFGRMASKIILAHVTKMPFPMFTVQMVPLVAGSIIVNLPVLFDIDPIFTPQTEHYYLWGFFVFAFVAYFNWALLVINRFCRYLGIHCLRIAPQPKKGTAAETIQVGTEREPLLDRRVNGRQ